MSSKFGRKWPEDFEKKDVPLTAYVTREERDEVKEILHNHPEFNGSVSRLLGKALRLYLSASFTKDSNSEVSQPTLP